MNEYVYHIVPTRLEMLTEGFTPKEADLTSQHVAYLQGLLEEGILILAGRTQNSGDETFGIVVFRAPDEEAAREIMDADPAVRGGLMHARLYPYKIAFIEARKP